MNNESLIDSLRALRAAALDQEVRLREELSLLHPNFEAGGRNLAHYLATRQQDLRELQRGLARLGLSSLGRMEKCVIPTLDAVEHALTRLGSSEPCSGDAPVIDFEGAQAALERNAAALLGPAVPSRATRIMVTLGLDANVSLLEQLLADGADVLRINCAKGEREDWSRLVRKIRATERKVGRSCRILCDLAGPNPRSAALDADHDPDEALGRVSIGDRLFVARARPTHKQRRQRSSIPQLGFTLPQVLDDLQAGERLFYDDGRMIGVVADVSEEGALIAVTFTQKPRLKLKANKTLNFPDTLLSLPSLTEQDLEALDFVAENADLVGLSFVRAPRDVELLQAEIAKRTERQLGVVLKIETTQAFNDLPRLLLTAMRSPRVGVMVARGDMAVELGFVRLAEAQEEILWLCEAALVPVIWATQVLESLNQSGVPSRAEVTDAAMSGRAECVMLNRGEHVVEALKFLREVLERMQEHQEKKRSMLRRLRISSLD